MSTPLKLTGFVFDHVVRALSGVLPAGAAADKGLSEYFRAHPQLGQTDRSMVAETIYAVLRHKRSLMAACGSEYPRELALAALARVRGMNLKQFEHVLRPGETDLMVRIKSYNLEEAPPAVRADLPDWLWERLVAERGTEGAQVLARGLKQPAPLDLRVNLVKLTREGALEQLRAAGLAGEITPYSPHGIRVVGKPVLQRNALFLSGGVEVQDEGSQLLAGWWRPKPRRNGGRFLRRRRRQDPGPGRADALFSGRLYALRISRKPPGQVKPRLSRTGLSNVHPLRIESRERPRRSNAWRARPTGCWSTRPAAAWARCARNPRPEMAARASDDRANWRPSRPASSCAARLVKPGGRLVYATCSLLEQRERRGG